MNESELYILWESFGGDSEVLGLFRSIEDINIFLNEKHYEFIVDPRGK